MAGDFRENQFRQDSNKTRRGESKRYKRNTSRKSWPSPELIITLLRDNGYSVKTLCKELNISYYVIRCYRDENPEFAVEYEKIIAEQEVAREKEYPNYKSLKEKVEGDWKSKFLYMYGKTYKREAARNFAEVEATLVEDSLDPASISFDKDFAHSIRDLAIRRKWTVEDMLWDKAPGDRTIFRDLLRMEFPEVFSTNQTILNQGIIAGISSGADQKAIAFLREIFDKPEPILVESTPCEK